MKQIMEKYTKEKRKLSLVFIDLINAYDNFNKDKR